MSEIEAHYRSRFVSGCRNGPHIECLAGVVIHTSEHNQRDLVAVTVDRVHDVFRSQSRFAFARRELDQVLRLDVLSPAFRRHRLVRWPTLLVFMKSYLRSNRILIGWECAFLDHDLAPLSHWPIE